MEYAPNCDLTSHIQPGVGLEDIRLPRFYAANIILALKYMHERQLVHRDIKPGNLLVDTHHRLKVCDYGFARVLPHGERTHSIAGTLPYNSPEQFLGEGYDHSVDLWALGVTVYEMLFGALPFDFRGLQRLENERSDDSPAPQMAVIAGASKRHHNGGVSPDVSQCKRTRTDDMTHAGGKKPGSIANNTKTTHMITKGAAARMFYTGAPFPDSHDDDPACTAEAIRFVCDLLQFFRDERLASNLDYRQLLNHEWFLGFDWYALELGQMPAPGRGTGTRM